MISSQMIRNLNTNMRRLDATQLQLSTGMKINKPSDDPVGITYGLRYRSELAANEQYQTNTDNALSWLDFTDKMLGQSIDVLHRVRELTTQAATGTNPQVALDSIQSEIVELREQLVQIGNSQLAGKYVFNGQKYDEMPYTDVNAATVVTDPGEVRYEVGAGVTLGINSKGTEIFGDPSDSTETDHVFEVLDRIISSLGSGDYDGVNAEIPNIETRVNKISSVRAEVGAKVNRAELVQERLKDLELNLTTLQSKTEDADYSELLVQAQTDESIYQASLQVGARIITPTLIDYLR